MDLDTVSSELGRRSAGMGDVAWRQRIWRGLGFELKHQKYKNNNKRTSATDAAKRHTKRSKRRKQTNL